MATDVKRIALVLVAAALAWVPAMGASAAEVEDCVTVPAGINNQSVLGKEIPGLKDVKICVHSASSVTGEPKVREYEGCGEPCFAIVVRDVAVAVDVQVRMSYTLGGQPQPSEPVGATKRIEPVSGAYQCVYSYYEGGFNPCSDGVSTPANLKAAARRAKVTLQWDRSFAFGESSVQHYEIQRSTTGEEGSFVPVGTTTGLTFTDTTVASGTTYWYTVLAEDDRGNRSGTAAPVSVSTS